MEIGFAWCKPLTRILQTAVVTTTMMVCSVRGSHLPLVIRQYNLYSFPGKMYETFLAAPQPLQYSVGPSQIDGLGNAN